MSETLNIEEEGFVDPIRKEEVNENRSPTKAIEQPQLQITNSQLETKNMEVHKHPHHVMHKKKWSEYLLEFIMLFLAVFLGFIAENIREHSVEKARAKQYAVSLINDLEKDTAMAQVDIRQMRFTISKIDTLAKVLKTKKISEITNRQLFAYTLLDGDYRPYMWSRATLDEIKSSGSLRYMGNDSIIMRVSAYDAFTKHMDEDFNGDVERSDKLAAEKNRIIDKSYNLPDSTRFFLLSADSVIDIISQNNGQQDVPLLTNNINDIKNLLNDYFDIKSNLKIRANYELTNLIKQATQLIDLLRKQYDIK
jgi:hypothetical protein